MKRGQRASAEQVGLMLRQIEAQTAASAAALAFAKLVTRAGKSLTGGPAGWLI